jgi:hypothetical protein
MTLQKSYTEIKGPKTELGIFEEPSIQGAIQARNIERLTFAFIGPTCTG